MPGTCGGCRCWGVEVEVEMGLLTTWVGGRAFRPLFWAGGGPDTVVFQRLPQGARSHAEEGRVAFKSEKGPVSKRKQS